MYTYKIIDPRPASREKELAFLKANVCLGIEVTIPELAEACSLGNIDPQHSNFPNKGEMAAIEVAVSAPLPPEGAVLVTVRPDADSIGSMAVLKMRAAGTSYLSSTVTWIASRDKYDNGEWAPSSNENVASIHWKAMGAMCQDHKTSIENRVSMMETFLRNCEVPARYLDEVNSDLSVPRDIRVIGRVAVVESTARGAIQSGYAVAPVVIAINQEFRIGGGEPHRKVTVCQFDPSWVDMEAVKRKLAAMEPGWGGSATIIGSPQGTDTNIQVEKILEVVENHLRR